MAGMGKRLRPQTLLTPKPLLMICGKTILERILDEILISINRNIDTIHYVIGDFGEEWITFLKELTERKNIRCKYSIQKEALGTAHAVYCAKESLKGNVLITFADTLFRGNINIGEEEGIIWTYRVKNPDAYGVVTVDENDIIEHFIEKPKDRISDRAIIGMYYLEEGSILEKSIDYLIKRNLKENNEFQLTNCLEELKNGKIKFVCKEIQDWMDCGNRKEFLKTHKIIVRNEGKKENLELKSNESNNKIIEPVYIGSNVYLENCVIGPDVSIEKECIIKNSKISNSIIYEMTLIEECDLRESMVGENSQIIRIKGENDIGPYNVVKNEK